MAAAGAATDGPATVFFDFRGTVAAEVESEMKEELARLFRDSPRQFSFRRLQEASELGPLPDLAVLRIEGDCRMPPAWPAMDERGPFAWTHISGGTVLSFGAVDCERLRGAVATALWGGDRARGNQMLGRALARVAAHELLHIFTGSKRHGRGLARPGLTAAELVAPKGAFTLQELHAMDGPPALAKENE
ncbi:MAG: hypothetical protein R2729_30280 [Bryobacteraceae bacterium]